MKRRSSRYPFATFVNLTPTAELEFASNVRLYGRVISFMFAKEFASITGCNAVDREENRRGWFRRLIQVVGTLCHVRGSFDDELVAQSCSTPVRWACGTATLASLLVEPQILAAHSGIREHAEHMERFLNGRDLQVTIYSTKTNQRHRPSLCFSVQQLRTCEVPRVTSDTYANLQQTAVLQHQHTVGMLRMALSATFSPAHINLFRRHVAEVAMSQPSAIDAHEFLTTALFGAAEHLAVLRQSLSPPH